MANRKRTGSEFSRESLENLLPVKFYGEYLNKGTLTIKMKSLQKVCGDNGPGPALQLPGGGFAAGG